MRRVLAVAIFGAMMASTAAAEPPLPRGSRIRVRTISPKPAKGDVGRACGSRLHEYDDSVTTCAPGAKPLTRTKPHRWLVGTLIAMDERFVIVQPTGHLEPAWLSRREIVALQVSSGKKSRLRPALVGALAGGAMLAGAFALHDRQACPGAELPDCLRAGPGRRSPLQAAKVGALIGVPLGALLGALTRGADRWWELPREPPPVAVSFGPTDGGVAASVSIDF